MNLKTLKAKHFLCSPLWKTPHSGSVLDSVITFSLGGFPPLNGFLMFALALI